MWSRAKPPNAMALKSCLIAVSLTVSHLLLSVSAEQEIERVANRFVNESSTAFVVSEPNEDHPQSSEPEWLRHEKIGRWSHRLSRITDKSTIGNPEHATAPRRLDVQQHGVGILRKVVKHLGISQMPMVWMLVWILSMCITLTAVCYMIPHQAAQNTMRLPPRWEPGLENALPFRTWLQDLLLWTITSDLEPHRQAAAIISQLGGAARELARTLTPQEIFNGGVINGQHLDPVSFLIHGLSTRFSPLDDEIRIRAAQDLLQFQRKGNESVDVLITRFETIRSRARAEGGGANVSTESASLILLRAIGVSSEQFQRLTQPFGLRLPNSEAELAQLMHQLRRMGHIIEHHPSNIADSLHRNVGASSGGQAFVVHSADGSADPSQTSWSYVGQSLPPQSSDTWEMPGQYSQSSTDWAYHVDPNVASDTDSATESDDFQQQEDNHDLEGLTAGEADEHLFWQYTEAKRRWRSYTGKPVRALRRVLRRKGKGKGKGKVKGSFFDITNALHESSYFRAKGKGGKSSGKGWGRRQNPKGRDGEILKCSICSSQYHLRARCPQNRNQRGFVQPASGPQSSQLPIPPGRTNPPSMAGFVSAQSEVTQSDGQVGPASLHFATSQEEGDASHETPRRSGTPEVHVLTPDDPWMNWHEDPWRRNVASDNVHQPQPSSRSFAFADPLIGAFGAGQPMSSGLFQPTGSDVLFPNLPGYSIPGVWPPPQLPERFPGAVTSSAQPSMNRPELGPSLLPASEAQTMTQLFGMVAQQHQQSSEEFGRESYPEMQPHQHALFSQLSGGNPAHGTGQGVGDLYPSDHFGQGVGVASSDERPSRSVASEIPTMFNQVYQLRTNRQQPDNELTNNGSTNTAPRQYIPSIFVPTLAEAGNDAPMNSSSEQVSAPTHQPPTRYEGDEDTCSICQLQFVHHDNVCRLPCRHVFHQTCIDEMIARDDDSACPNCRGAATVIATWRYLAPIVEEPANPTATPAQSPRSQVSTVFHTPQAEVAEHVDRQPSFPWWPVPEAARTDKAGSFHVSTHRTEAGQLGLLVDPGSYGNLVGEHWIQDAMRVADENGYQTSKAARTPLEVGGVGKGTQRCTQEITVPAALRNADGCMTKASFSAPMIPSSTCPALLGLKSLVEHRAVLDLSEQRLILLPKDTPIEVPPGSEVYALERSSTGHLLLPIDDFKNLTLAQQERGSTVSKHLFADGKGEGPEKGKSKGKSKALSRAASVGPVATIPGYTPTMRDRWEIFPGEVVRIHAVPRTSLFHPGEVQDCPIPLQELMPERLTEVAPDRETLRVIQDSWVNVSSTQNHMEPWVGVTRFTRVPASGSNATGRSTGARINQSVHFAPQGASSSSSQVVGEAEQTESPTKWDVIGPS